MKKYLFPLFLLGCQVPYDFPNMNDVLDDICKETRNGYLIRKDDTKNYVLVGADDNLSSTDIAMVDIGLYCLGYQPYDIDIAVTYDNIKDLIQVPAHLFYFSGHGAHGGIGASDEFFNLRIDQEKFKAENVIFSACDVMKYPEVVGKTLDASVKYVMGYSDMAYDDMDNIVMLDMLKRMRDGHSIPMSFYLANVLNAWLYDRWVIYEQTDDGLIEYSARSKNKFVELGVLEFPNIPQ